MDGVGTPPGALRLWRVSSGWDGPFQYEDVLVAAPDAEAARVHAEAAFAGVNQPHCRARMRLFDLGDVREGAVGAPRRGGEAFGTGARETGVRCDDPAA